jgi:hypothetical protein
VNGLGILLLLTPRLGAVANSALGVYKMLAAIRIGAGSTMRLVIRRKIVEAKVAIGYSLPGAGTSCISSNKDGPRVRRSNSSCAIAAENEFDLHIDLMLG